MQTRQDMLLLSLFLILFEITSSSAQVTAQFFTVTIPREWEGVSMMAVVETTECSVTCGTGTKREKRCLVDRSGHHTNCEVVMVECLSNWLCGTKVYTLRYGERLTMDCQIPMSSNFVGDLKFYYWKKAAGIVSVNDNYFRTLKVRNSSITFQSIQEKDAGTYRCDVQRNEDMKIVKRIYFAVRVITPGIIDINYDKNVISKTKLEALAQEHNRQGVKKFVEKYGGTSTYVVIGSTIGILMGIAVLMFCRCNFTSTKNEDLESTTEL
ncbi:transmembrane protein 81 [Anomaloglossus baeobatrachus]|uniref:transmembrane protein 81 n=1 Tax=Anomaloglossus baeobatrachus TaxID=238106 RepID=UPI003F4F7333